MIENLAIKPLTVEPLLQLSSQQMKHFDIQQEYKKCSISRQWNSVENEQFPRKQEQSFIPESAVFRKNFSKLKMIDGSHNGFWGCPATCSTCTTELDKRRLEMFARQSRSVLVAWNANMNLAFAMFNILLNCMS